MRIVDTEYIAKKIGEIYSQICTNLEESTLCALQTARQKESNKNSAFALDIILKNAEMAHNEHLPVCQDTGMCIIYMEIGQKVTLSGELLQTAVDKEIENVYLKNHFRMSICDSVTRINTNYNTPCVLNISIVAGDKIKISCMAKGFGSENMSKLYMLSPFQLDKIEDFVVQAVVDAKSSPCPPIIVGVGIGGNSALAMQTSQNALFRKVGSSNEDITLDKMEKSLLNKINSLGIGAGGFGGDTTALAVFCKKVPTHIAGLPVGVSIVCHCNRKAEIII